MEDDILIFHRRTKTGFNFIKPKEVNKKANKKIQVKIKQ